jgi:hypothetical protein
LQLKLFDSLVELIILYGSEVLGFWKSTNHGKIYLKFCKRILNLRLTTLNYMVYGAIFCHLPVSMGNFIFEHLNFDKLILFFADKLDK